MQQLTIEHKKVKKDRRPGKGRAMALSRRIYRLQNTKITCFYYVESETRDHHYYLVKFKPDVLESLYCSCKDYSARHTKTIKCKHIFAIEFAIKWGTIKDKVPASEIKAATAIAETDVKLDTPDVVTTKPAVVISVARPQSYKDDDYTF